MGIFVGNDYVTVNGCADSSSPCTAGRNITVQNTRNAGYYSGGYKGNILTNIYFLNNPTTFGSWACGAITMKHGPDNSDSNEVSYNLVENPWGWGIYAEGYLVPGLFTDNPPGWPTRPHVIVHDNEVKNFDGNDYIDAMNYGVEVYRNSVHGVRTPRRHDYHLDGIVVMGNYMSIHDNIAYDMDDALAEYGPAMYYINPSPTACTTCQTVGLRFYNNVAIGTLSGTGSPRITFDFDDSTRAWNYISDILVANNTFVNVELTGLEFLYNKFTNSNATLRGIKFVNNIWHNNAWWNNNLGYQMRVGLPGQTFTAGGWGSGANIEYDYNINSNGGGPNHYVFKGLDYTYTDWVTQMTYNGNAANSHATNPTNDPQLNSSNAYGLTGNSANAIGTGVNLTSYCSESAQTAGLCYDKDGNPRPSSGAWDIGAYRTQANLVREGINNTGAGGHCFIATAAYGSYLDPHVKVLRYFRDKYLLTNPIGSEFVCIYYRYSPPAAYFIAHNESLRTLVRWSLTPVVYTIEYPIMLGFIIIPVMLRARKKLNNQKRD